MRHALITFGNEESYGLLFVGGELLLHEQEIKFFDGEDANVAELILEWEPDFIMFSPLTVFFARAESLALYIKSFIHTTSIFGGHHVMADQTPSDAIDTIVIGPVRGSIERILIGERGIIRTDLTTPDDLPFPAREEYYRDIPRMKNRYRKFMLSTFGCPWNCSYCSASSGNMKRRFGSREHRNYYLSRRPMHALMEEARDIVIYPTKEIEWVDDDILAGRDVETWLPRFMKEWKRQINLPMYVSTTSVSVLRATDEMLRALQGIVQVVALGVQAARKESLKLFNRSWDNEDRMKAAYDRLRLFGFSVNLQAIIGLPISDPIEDAFDTIKLMQKIGAGSICSVYPLQVYPDTKLMQYCKDGKIDLSSNSGDTNTGLTGIKFDPKTTKRLRNICKLATLFVKYNIDERWMRSLVDLDFDENASKQLSETRYHDCVVDRLNETGEEIFEDVINATRIRY